MFSTVLKKKKKKLIWGGRGEDMTRKLLENKCKILQCSLAVLT